MNKTVELVNEWASYEESHPEASIEEFCRYYLTAQRSKRELGPNFRGTGIPPKPGSYLMKLVGHITKLYERYAKMAFSEIPEIKQPEDFYILNYISYNGESRKTDIVNHFLMGISTGIDVLNRLIINELIEERGDPDDKRARLVKITEKGRAVLQPCYAQAQKVSDIVLSEVSDDDIQLVIQLLRGVEAKHSSLIFELRDKPIDEVYERVVKNGGRLAADD